MVTNLAVPISSENQQKLQFISDYDFSHIKARMAVDYSYDAEHYEKLERELKRFLALFVLEQESHFFTEKADGLWHYFILHTKEYNEFCSNVYGRFLNHNPMLPHEAPSHLDQYNRTKSLYTKYFGTPSVELWGKEGVCCMGCSGRFEKN